MRRRSTVLFLAIAVGLLLAIPVPASAGPPLRGDQDLVLEFAWIDGPPICASPAEAISWVGTIVFEGDTNVYGIAYVSQLPPPDPDKRANHFADEWRIYAAPLTGADGCPHPVDDVVVMWGFDKGVDVNLKATANGAVEEVDTAFFDESLEGRRVHWSGVTVPTGPTVLTFKGPFRIN
jgi:hypothetical protein